VFSKGTVLSPIKGKKEIYYWRGYYGNSAEVDISAGGELLRLREQYQRRVPGLRFAAFILF
jgi:hypothetical protein